MRCAAMRAQRWSPATTRGPVEHRVRSVVLIRTAAFDAADTCQGQPPAQSHHHAMEQQPHQRAARSRRTTRSTFSCSGSPRGNQDPAARYWRRSRRRREHDPDLHPREDRAFRVSTTNLWQVDLQRRRRTMARFDRPIPLASRRRSGRRRTSPDQRFRRGAKPNHSNSNG